MVGQRCSACCCCKFANRFLRCQHSTSGLQGSTLSAHAGLVHAGASLIALTRWTAGSLHACCTHLWGCHTTQTGRRCCGRRTLCCRRATMLLLRTTTCAYIEIQQQSPRAAKVAPYMPNLSPPTSEPARTKLPTPKSAEEALTAMPAASNQSLTHLQSILTLFEPIATIGIKVNVTVGVSTLAIFK